MERVKILIGTDDTGGSGPASIATTNVLRSFLARKQEMDAALEKEQGLSRNHDVSPLAPKQAWIETDLSLEDASIIEDVEEIPKDRERMPLERERSTNDQPPSLTGIHARLASGEHSVIMWMPVL